MIVYKVFSITEIILYIFIFMNEAQLILNSLISIHYISIHSIQRWEATNLNEKKKIKLYTWCESIAYTASMQERNIDDIYRYRRQKLRPDNVNMKKKNNFRTDNTDNFLEQLNKWTLFTFFSVQQIYIQIIFSLIISLTRKNLTRCICTSC